ncbi:MAG: MFS transporter, partial [Candidatus Rokuibacteriota bacterium]
MRRQLFGIGLITLVFNLGGGLVAPALPLYARTLGADYRDLGLIGAAHGLAFAALTIPLGRASDRVGRRAILVLSGIGV